MVKKASTVTRVLQFILGLLGVFFGLNGFFQWFSPPAPAGAVETFFQGIMASVYLFPLILLTLIVTGVLFLINKWPAFAAVLLAPLSLNILLFHLFLDLAGGVIGYVFFILNVYLLYAYADRYIHMLK